MSRAPQTTPYEQAVAAICFGVFFIGVGTLMALTSPDLGESIGRAGLPAWVIVGLLWICGAGAIVAGLVKLIRGARP